MNPIFEKMNEGNTLCIFHAPDLDGWMSCAVAMEAGIAAEDCSNVYWYSYDKLDPDDLARRMRESGRDSFDYVLTGDISLPEEAVFTFELYGIKVVTTDHHASSIRTYAGKKALGWKSLYVSTALEDEHFATSSEVFWIDRDNCKTRPEKVHGHNYCFFPKEGEKISGALLLWLAIHGDNTGRTPEVLELVSAWDAWDLDSEYRERGVWFNCALVSRMNRACLLMDRNDARNYFVQHMYHYFLAEDRDAPDWLIPEIIEEGKLLMKHNEGEWARTARSAYTIQWEGCRLLCLNARGSSLVCKSVYDPEQHEGIVMWAVNKEGKISVSLFNENVTDSSPDFSAIAKKHGGGGHKGAAGCILSKIPPEFLTPVE